MCPYESYFLEPGNRRFKALADNPTLAQIYNFMALEEHVTLMIEASESLRPALEPLIELIELEFPFSEDFNILLIHRHRQILGSFCRFILQPHGYYPVKSVKLKKGRYINTATIYSR